MLQGCHTLQAERRVVFLGPGEAFWSARVAQRAGVVSVCHCHRVLCAAAGGS